MGGQIDLPRPGTVTRIPTAIIEAVSGEDASSQTMVQRYIPEISAGDKRILLIDGIAIPYALARLPAPGENRGNIAAGASTRGQPLSERDQLVVRTGRTRSCARVVCCSSVSMSSAITSPRSMSPARPVSANWIAISTSISAQSCSTASSNASRPDRSTRHATGGARIRELPPSNRDAGAAGRRKNLVKKEATQFAIQ